MEQKVIDIPELYKYSFSLLQKHGSFVIGCMATYFVLAIIPQVYFILRAPADPTTQSQILNFLLTLMQLYVGVGFIKIMLYLVDNIRVGVGDLFNNSHIFISYFVGSFLYGAAVFIGLLLFILPGIYIAIRFQFYPYYIIEHNDNSFEALKKSFYATGDIMLELFLFGITVVLANFIGLLFLGVGILLTYPLTTLATAIIYRSLSNDEHRIPPKDFASDRIDPTL